MKTMVCIYYSSEGVKPNSGCATCPKFLQDVCNEKGEIPYNAVLLMQKGADLLASARKAVERLARKLGTEVFVWAISSAGYTTVVALPPDTRSLAVEAAIRAVKRPRKAKRSKVEVIPDAPRKTEERSPETEDKVN